LELVDIQIKIEEIKKEITVKNFAELAKKYSTDPITQKSGGDLGTLNKESYVPELSSAVWDAPVGTIVGPLESKYGFHLVYKKAEAKIKQYQVAGIWFKTKTKTDFVPPEGAWKVTGLGGKQLKRAEVIENPQSGQIQVSLKFDEEGTKLFSDITTRNVGKKIGIFIDGEPITNPPTVNEPINSGDAVISGSFSLADARKLAQQLNLGALPVGVELLSQQHIGASLGADSLHKSFTAGIWGLIAIMIFMIVYYRLPAILADHRKQSTRFFNGTSNFVNEFGATFVAEHMRIPLSVILKGFWRALPEILRHPIRVTCYLGILLLMRIESFFVKQASDTWMIAESSKQLR
jgi:hypothetical protein